ncbi:unnamed protein product [Caenorhabditis angaria]|uniref:Uncharacterized protein n=1 Tax=Caenorhabditis angaria TaxID=860376 RepID=A0A9P1IPB0_9PELO|nr:unnamed protein product [Caenorhabditis angaria]
MEMCLLILIEICANYADQGSPKKPGVLRQNDENCMPHLSLCPSFYGAGNADIKRRKSIQHVELGILDSNSISHCEAVVLDGNLLINECFNGKKRIKARKLMFYLTGH